MTDIFHSFAFTVFEIAADFGLGSTYLHEGSVPPVSIGIFSFEIVSSCRLTALNVVYLVALILGLLWL